jgi:hypothetical protein
MTNSTTNSRRAKRPRRRWSVLSLPGGREDGSDTWWFVTSDRLTEEVGKGERGRRRAWQEAKTRNQNGSRVATTGPRRRGRPLGWRKIGGKPRSVMIRMSDAMYDWLDERARATGFATSEVVRQMIEAGMPKRPKGRSPSSRS